MSKATDMLIGINCTSPANFAKIQDLIFSKHVDYVEILIDNFLSCDPKTIRNTLGDMPIAFHIMWSRFLEVPPSVLLELGGRLKEFIQAVNPIYISDHLAQFTCDGLPLPVLAEINYELLPFVTQRVLQWQEILGQKLFIENFPSLFKCGTGQPGFFEKLIHGSGCGVLFDVSNAIVARNNINLPLSAWANIISQTSHFHVGGYRPLDSDPILWVDTHDGPISSESKDAVTQFFDPGSLKTKTLTIEFDHNIDSSIWQLDIEWARGIHKSSLGEYNAPQVLIES